MKSHLVCIALTGIVLVTLGMLRSEGQTSSGPAVIEMTGVKAEKKFEAAVQGFLTPVNDKLKLRATEVSFAPQGSVGDHLHAGPGIRLLLAGDLTVVDAETGREQQVHAGEYFYESGDRSLRAYNRNSQPAKLLIVELLPASLQGGAMVPLSRRAELEQEGGRLRELACSK